MQHIILAAFGTVPKAEQTYARIDTVIAERFPGARRHWYFSSPATNRTTGSQTPSSGATLADLIKRATKPGDRIVVQSLHLTPGIEFHHLMQEASRIQGDIHTGMPLLHHPGDYHRVACSLLPLLPPPGSQAVLLIGHGTHHPSWTTLPVLAATLRQEAGPHIFLAVLRHYPDSSGIIDEIVAAGYRDVLLLPFLLATGTHFTRDIAGSSPSSWANRIQSRGLGLSMVSHGLGPLPGIAEIFADHIAHALAHHDEKGPVL